MFKVDRIVGQKPGVDMMDILQYRQQFYEGNYDIRIIVEPNEPPESITVKIVKALEEMQNPKGISWVYRLSKDYLVRLFSITLKFILQATCQLEELMDPGKRFVTLFWKVWPRTAACML